MSKPSPIFYVFYGSDEFTRAEAVRKLRARLGAEEAAELNAITLDGRKVTLARLRHACEAPPFLAERRLVVVTGLLSRLKKEQQFLKSLLDLLPRLPETTRLVFLEEGVLPDSNPVLKLVQEHERGYARRFEPPTSRGLGRWVRQRAQKRGGEIEPQAAEQLARAVGQDLRLLDQEIGKLVTYAGPERAVTVEDVALLVPYVQETVIFDLVDALGRRDGRVAAVTLHRLLEEGRNPRDVLRMVVRQFRLLIQVKELQQRGENAPSIARALGIHPFPAGKLYRQATNFTPAQLEQVYRHLLEVDLQTKSGGMTVETALDLLVAGLTGEGGTASPR